MTEPKAENGTSKELQPAPSETVENAEAEGNVSDQ